MISVMPRSCDPTTAWWQGSVILEIGPTPAEGGGMRLNREFWIERLPLLAGLGLRGLKLVDIYLIQPAAAATNNGSGIRAEYYNPGSLRIVEERAGSAAQLRELAEAVHAANLSLLVEIPTYSGLVVMSLDLR
jgi:hypothetical protein